MHGLYQELVLTNRDGVAVLTLNRPDRLNALNPRLLGELVDALAEARADDSAHVLILTGVGRGFCVGPDLEQVQPAQLSQNGHKGYGAPPEVHLILSRTLPLMLADLGKPTIAAVNGLAVGGGLGLALACDIRIASEAARFSSLLIQRALAPDSGTSYWLPRLVGFARAAELMYTGEMIDAREAERIGLVSRVVPPDNLLAAATGLAGRIAAGPPLALRLTRDLLQASREATLAQQLDREVAGLQTCLVTEDFREGLAAFQEKRAPRFVGR